MTKAVCFSFASGTATACQPGNHPYSYRDYFRGGKRYCENYQFHANCYLSKPVHFDAFESLVKSVNDFWLPEVKLPQVRQKQLSKLP